MVDNNSVARPCPVCEESDPESFRIWFDGYVKLFRCLRCGFVAQFPGPGENTIVTDYEYACKAIPSGGKYVYPRREVDLLDIFDRVAEIKPDHVKICDFGC